VTVPILFLSLINKNDVFSSAKLPLTPIPSLLYLLIDSNFYWFGVIEMCKHTFLLVAAIWVGAFAIPFDTAQADAVSINESQKDTLKCDKVKNCYQVTAGTYSVLLKLSKDSTRLILATLLQNTATVDEINKSPIKVNLGVFEFAESLSTAVKNKAKITPTSLQGTWVKSHVKCLKYNAAGICKSSKTIVDGTVKLNLDTKTGGLLTLTGQSGDERGQKLYADKCRDNGLGLTTLPDNFVVIVADRMLTAPMNVSCKVKKPTKTVKNIRFELTSITATAKLVQPTVPFVFSSLKLIAIYSDFYLAPSPIGVPESVGFKEFSEPGDGFVSITLKDSFKKADAIIKSADIDFIYYLLGNSTAVFASTSLFNQQYGPGSEALEKYDWGWKGYSSKTVFFNVYSPTSYYYDSNGGVLYYQLSEEEFDRIKSRDEINAVVNHSTTNAPSVPSTEFRFNYDGSADKTDSQAQIVGLAVVKNTFSVECLMKILPEFSVYALRVQVKCSQ